MFYKCRFGNEILLVTLAFLTSIPQNQYLCQAPYGREKEPFIQYMYVSKLLHCRHKEYP